MATSDHSTNIETTDNSPTAETTVIQVNAPTHLPTKLTQTNFLVWRTQLQSTLIGLGVLGYLDGIVSIPNKHQADGKSNPAFSIWNRQDKIILSAMLGSCHEAIQPLISTSETSKEMWERLVTLFANKSRSRIISLKSHLHNNPCNSRSIAEYLQDIRSTADELALAGHPISDDDLVLHVLAGLGDDYKDIGAAIKIRESPMTFGELHEKLSDCERGLQSKYPEPIVVTANFTQKGYPSHRGTNSQQYTNRSITNSYQQNRNHANRYQNNWGNRGHQSNTSNNRSNNYCHFCQRPNHSTKACRQLAKFLKDNEISTPSPTANNTVTNSAASQRWLFDTGASHHITNDPSTYTTFSEYGGPDEILMGNGSGLKITHTGTSQLHSVEKPLKLSNVLCAPSLSGNLISVAKLCTTNQVSVEFFPSTFQVKDLKTGVVLMQGKNKNDVYYALNSNLPQINSVKISTLASWHNRLGHPAFPTLRSILASNKLVDYVPSNFTLPCNACFCNKSRKLPFGASSMTSSKPLELLYTDVWGPTTKSVDNYRYYIIFVDHYTKYIWLYPLKQKSDVKNVFVQFKNIMEKFFQLPVIFVYSDNGGEYVALHSIFNSLGISHFTTPPHTPEHNGPAECRHGHIVQTGLTLLQQASLPLKFWSHAFLTAVYLINRMPSKSNPTCSPLEKLFGRTPNYKRLKVFGCLCYPWLRPYAPSKIHPKSTPCVFLGYSSAKSAYKCFDTKNQRLYFSRHVRFVENHFPMQVSSFCSSQTASQTTRDQLSDTSSWPIP